MKTLEAPSAPDGYKQTELGPLPEDWEVVQLGEVITKTEQINPAHAPDVTFEYIDVSAVSNERLRITGTTWCCGRTAPSRARKRVRAGDVIFATVRPYLRRIAAVPAELDGQVCSTAFCVIRAERGRSDPEFLFFAVSSNRFVSSVIEHQRGSGYPAVTDKDVLGQVIPLPPLPEQRAIAGVLRRVQEAREATEAVIASARELKKSLMRHLFTYGPVPADQADQVPLKETEIGQVPEHWEVVRLGDLFQAQQGASMSPRRREGQPQYPFLRTLNVLWGRVDLTTLDQMHLTSEELARLSLKAGDLLVCEGGEIGRTALWRGQLELCAYQNHVHRLRAKHQDMIPDLYVYWMQAAMLLFGLYGAEGNRTTIPNLSQSRLSAFPVPLPPLVEQQEITSILSAVDRKIGAEENRKRALEALFKTLLHNLMTGKIRVRDLNTQQALEPA